MRRSFLLFGLDDLPTEPFADFLREVQIPGIFLDDIDNELQKRFFQKNPDGSAKERWELDKVQLNCSAERIKQHLSVCGFMDKTKPMSRQYNYAAWPGALLTRATVRLNDLIGAWKDGVRWEKMIVFGGKRPLQANKENYEACCKTLNKEGAELEAARRWWEYINPQTEIDIMRWIWRNIELPDDFAGAENVFVNAPMKPPLKEGGLPIRPSTEDTVQEWLKSGPKSGSILLSSGAPYGMAQDEGYWTLLEPHGFTVETFGHAAPDLPIENFMREVAGAVSRIRRARI